MFKKQHISTESYGWRGALRFFLGALVTIGSGDCFATDWIVEVGGTQLAFSPATLNNDPGDSVTFTNRGGLHNVDADDGSFRCAHGCDNDGSGGNGSPSSLIWFATVTFQKAGTHGYFCETHGSPGIGMFGTINVIAPPSLPTPQVPGLNLLSRWMLACVIAIFGALFAARSKTR